MNFTFPRGFNFFWLGVGLGWVGLGRGWVGEKKKVAKKETKKT